MKNWKKYSFEFLSIFVAVISAFALNNWNENRKSGIAESKILSEIYYGLEKDLEDVDLNILGHETGNKSAIYFRNLLAGKPVAPDSLMYHYFHVTRDFVSVQNISGYETLKSRGLEILENDSLRTKIISLYEYDYNTLRKLEEEYYELQFQANYFKEINEVLSRNFQFNENNMVTGISTPLEVSEKEEKLLLSYLWRIQANRNYMLNYYEDVKNKINTVRQEIKVELDQ